MDLTVPSGASSVSPLIGVGRWDAGTDLRVRGEMNRSLLISFILVLRFERYILVVEVEQELVVQAFYVFDSRDD